jgi:hypothetical protein
MSHAEKMYAAFDTLPAKQHQQPDMSDEEEIIDECATDIVNHQEHHNAFSKVVKMDKLGREVRYLAYITADGVQPLDFQALNTAETNPQMQTMSEALKAQTESLDGDFHATRSIFTVEHLTPALLNEVGKPIASNKTYLCVIPPLPTTNATKDKARAYMGLAMHRKTHAFVAYRLDGDKFVQHSRIKKLKEMFTMYFENEALRALVHASKNARIAKFTLPLNDIKGINVTMNIPYMPTSLYAAMLAEEKKAAEEPVADLVVVKKQKIDEAPPAAPAPLASKVKMLLADVMDDNEKEEGEVSDEDAPDVPPKAPPKKKTKKPAATPLSSDAEDDDDDGGESKIVASMKVASKLSPTQAKEAAFPVGQPPAPPAIASAPVPHRRIAVLVPVPRRAQETDAISAEVLLAHAAYKTTEESYKRLRPVFADKLTIGAALRDEQTCDAIWQWMRVTEQLFPHLIGLAAPPALPDGAVCVSFTDVL